MERRDASLEMAMLALQRHVWALLRAALGVWAAAMRAAAAQWQASLLGEDGRMAVAFWRLFEAVLLSRQVRDGHRRLHLRRGLRALRSGAQECTERQFLRSLSLNLLVAEPCSRGAASAPEATQARRGGLSRLLKPITPQPQVPAARSSTAAEAEAEPQQPQWIEGRFQSLGLRSA